MKKAEKPIFVENLAAELALAKSVVLINFAGLSVKSQQELKRRLVEVDAKMVVVKTGISDDNYLEIKSGLSEGDVVISGSYRAISRELEDGSIVRVEEKKNGNKKSEMVAEE